MGEKRQAGKQTPVEIVDELPARLKAKIGDIAEDDWLLLDDFEGHCEAVRRQWERASRVSIGNPEVREELLDRCEKNHRLADAAFSAIVEAWLERR